MIVPYLIGWAWVYDFWRAFRSNCSDPVFAATLLGVLYVPMTSETDQRSRGEVWDEVVARCAMIFCFFHPFDVDEFCEGFRFLRCLCCFTFSEVLLPGVWRIQHIWHDIQLWWIIKDGLPRVPRVASPCCVVGEREKTQNRRPPHPVGPVQLTASSHRNRKDIALPRVQRCSFE